MARFWPHNGVFGAKMGIIQIPCGITESAICQAGRDAVIPAIVQERLNTSLPACNKKHHCSLLSYRIKVTFYPVKWELLISQECEEWSKG